jgi:hypothetical protein
MGEGELYGKGGLMISSCKMLMKRTKIFYVPGMISLVVLPLVFICWTNSWMPKEEFATRIYLAKDDPDYKKGDLFSQFSGQGIMESIKSFEKTEIYLSVDDSILLPQQFDLIFHELQRLSFTNRANEVLIVHMNNETTFAQFVELHNMANIVRMKRWAYWNDAWYFIGSFPEEPNYNKAYVKPITALTCGYSDYMPPQQEPHYWQNTKDKILELSQNKGLWILLAYIFLFGTVSYKFIRKNKTL